MFSSALYSTDCKTATVADRFFGLDRERAKGEKKTKKKTNPVENLC